jgi:DNA-binding transcriptional LysR family regulator
MRTEDLQLFVTIAETGSMTQAGDRLGLAKSVVSRRLAELEHELGVALFARSTRQMRLTAEGEDFRERIRPVLDGLEAATEALGAARGELRGVMRVAAPVSFGHTRLAAALFEFARLHPAVELRVELSDRQVDLLAEGFDLAIRIGRLGDSSLVARRLTLSRRVVVCSPEFARIHGRPRTLEELAALPVVAYSNRSIAREWLFATAYGERSIHPSVRLFLDSGEAALQAAIAGLGATVTPTFLAAGPVSRGELQVLPIEGATPVADDIHALRSAQLRPPRRVRALIDHLVTTFREPPAWDAGFASVAESATVSSAD